MFPKTITVHVDQSVVERARAKRANHEGQLACVCALALALTEQAPPPAEAQWIVGGPTAGVYPRSGGSKLAYYEVDAAGQALVRRFDIDDLSGPPEDPERHRLTLQVPIIVTLRRLEG